MNCEQALTAISAKLDGALSEAEDRALTAHLAQCPDCRRTYDELCAMDEAMDDLLCEAPEALSRRVMARVREEPKPARQHKITPAAFLAAAAVLAVILLGATGVVDVPGFGGRGTRSSASVFSALFRQSDAQKAVGFGSTDYAALANARGARVLVLAGSDVPPDALSGAESESYNGGTLYALNADAFETLLERVDSDAARLFTPNIDVASETCYVLVFPEE